jgi:hypothetical protein
MAGIMLNEAGNAIVYPSVSWAHKIFSMKTQSFPKGAVPGHLLGYLFKPGGDPATCARETINLSGATRVRSMNSCISRLRKKR